MMKILLHLKDFNGEDVYRAIRYTFKNKFVVNNYVTENKPYITIEDGGSIMVKCYFIMRTTMLIKLSNDVVHKII